MKQHDPSPGPSQVPVFTQLQPHAPPEQFGHVFVAGGGVGAGAGAGVGGVGAGFGVGGVGATAVRISCTCVYV